MKKTLVISPRMGSDFSMDLLWAGLVRRLGARNVIDFPQQQRHRLSQLDLVPTGDIARDYGVERRSLAYTGRLPEFEAMIPHEHLEKYTKQKIFNDEIGMVFCDEQEESFRHYCALGLHVKKIPTVVVAGHDRFWNISPEHVRQSYYRDNLRAMFIDDWQPEYDALPYAHLINLSTNYDHLWDVKRRGELLSQKVYDICFIGYNSNPERRAVVDHILKRWGHLNNWIALETVPNEMGNFVLRREYFERIARSKVCINLPGASTCGRALRYYEIPYVGSFMLSKAFPAKLLDPFVDGRDCMYFEALREMDEKIESMLRYPEIREMMAANGRLHAAEKHTVDARISYVFDTLEGK